LVAAREKASLAADLVAVAERQRQGVERFVQAGESPRFALERSDAELFKARADRAKAESAARAEELALGVAIGFERPAALGLSEGLDPAAGGGGGGDGGGEALDLETLLGEAVTRRAALSAATSRYQAQLERSKLAADRIQFLPTVSGGPRFQGDDVRGVA